MQHRQIKCRILAALTTAIAVQGYAVGFRVDDLRCEYAENPLGLNEAHPRLSWTLAGDGYAIRQEAYQVLIASTESLLAKDTGDLWDSGKIRSSQSQLVPYDGNPLVSRQRVWWKVRVWGADGAISAWSAPAFWETGLMNPDEWTARWIGLSPEFWNNENLLTTSGLPMGKWLWCSEAHRFYLRKTFNLDGVDAIRRAQLRLQADNQVDIWINGTPVSIPEPGSWNTAPTVDIQPYLKPGQNLICLKAFNTDTPDWFMSALRAGIQVDYTNDQPSLTLLTDGSWKTTRLTWPKVFMGDGFKEENWLKPEFNDVETPDIIQDIHPRLTRRSWYARKNFMIDEQPVAVRVYVTAKGFYELYLNGNKVGNQVLCPDPQMKSCRQVQTYDVTSALNSGTNCIAFMVGGATSYGHSVACSEEPLLLAQIYLTYSDGRTEKIVTDGSWSTSPSPLLEDAIQFGERYDARLEQDGWNRSDFVAGNWRPALETHTIPELPLAAQSCEPIRVTEERPALSVSEPVSGNFVYDFGQNAAGRIRLKIRNAQPGQRIVIYYGERLASDGQIVFGPYQDVIYKREKRARYMLRNIDVYFCRGGAEEIYQPRFTYTGFRYAQISGYPGTPDRDAVVQRVLHTDTPVTGVFECSNPLINRIWSNAQWSWRSNIHGTPTDCPTREKNPWLDVGVQCGRTACWYMNSCRFFTRWLVDGEQLGKAVGWEDMNLTLPWLLYVFYGDTVPMTKNYDVMKALADQRINRANNGLFNGEGHQWLDHVAIEKTDRTLYCSSFFYHSVDLLAKMARLLRRDEDAERYEALLPAILTGVNAQLFDPEHCCYQNGTQTAQLLPLAFGMVPDSLRKGVADSLVANISLHTNLLTTGMTGAKFLLPVLSEQGRSDVAWNLAVQTNFPSWGYMVERGATTMWESWKFDRLPADSGGSLNHPDFGSIGEWFFQTLAGIQPDENHPGFKHFFIQPYVPQDLEWAGAQYRSIYGLIRSRWEKHDGLLVMDVQVPGNTTATVCIPAAGVEKVKEVTGAPIVKANGIVPGYAVFELGSGIYRFESSGF